VSVAILEDEEIRKAAMPVTVEQYHLLYEAGIIHEKTELIEGVIIEKMPKSPRHSKAVAAILEFLNKSHRMVSSYARKNHSLLRIPNPSRI